MHELMFECKKMEILKERKKKTGNKCEVVAFLENIKGILPKKGPGNIRIY